MEEEKTESNCSSGEEDPATFLDLFQNEMKKQEESEEKSELAKAKEESEPQQFVLTGEDEVNVNVDPDDQTEDSFDDQTFTEINPLESPESKKFHVDVEENEEKPLSEDAKFFKELFPMEIEEAVPEINSKVESWVETQILLDAKFEMIPQSPYEQIPEETIIPDIAAQTAQSIISKTVVKMSIESSIGEEVEPTEETTEKMAEETETICDDPITNEGQAFGDETEKQIEGTFENSQFFNYDTEPGTELGGVGTPSITLEPPTKSVQNAGDQKKLIEKKEGQLGDPSNPNRFEEEMARAEAREKKICCLPYKIFFIIVLIITILILIGIGIGVGVFLSNQPESKQGNSNNSAKN